MAPFNDLGTTTRISEHQASELAAVIVEPLHRCITPAPGFLPGLRTVMLALLKGGVFLNPMGTKLYRSLAHDDEALGLSLAHFAAAIQEAKSCVA